MSLKATINPFTGQLQLINTSSGGGTPSNPDTSIQFNNAGSFDGSANLTWDGENLLLFSDRDVDGSTAKSLANWSSTITANASGSNIRFSGLSSSIIYEPVNDAISIAAAHSGLFSTIFQGSKLLQHIYGVQIFAESFATGQSTNSINGTVSLAANYNSGEIRDELAALVASGNDDFRGIDGTVRLSSIKYNSGIQDQFWSFTNSFYGAPSYYGSDTLPILGGLRIGNATNDSSGSITTVYGIKIENQDAGDTNYAIKTGLGLVDFGDTVTINSIPVVTTTGAQALSNKTGLISQWTNNVGYLTSVTNITGNSGTATALQTARNINGISFNGTADITITVPISTGVTGLGSNVATFLATPSSANLISVITDETGTGSLVFANTPTLVTPVLGTPTSGNLSNCTALPVGSITGLGTGIATWLATPSSANLIAAVTDETGTGALVFGTSPTITTSATISNALAANTSGEGLVLTNPTTAAAANQEYSPRIRFTGQGWKTTSVAASQTVDWIIENKPVQGTTNPTSTLVFSSQINAGGYTAVLTIGSTTGTITNTGGAFNPVLLAITGHSGTALITVGGTNIIGLSSSRLGTLSLGLTSSATSSADVIFERDNANILGIRNSTTAQQVNIYNTYTNSTNNELFNILWSSNVLHLGTNKGSGGGTARVLQIDYGGTTTSAVSIPITSGSITFAGKTVSPTKNLSTIYTVATLPAGIEGDIAAVNDALAPAFLAAIVGGGTIHTPVYYNGTAWVAF